MGRDDRACACLDTSGGKADRAAAPHGRPLAALAGADTSATLFCPIHFTKSFSPRIFVRGLFPFLSFSAKNIFK